MGLLVGFVYWFILLLFWIGCYGFGVVVVDVLLDWFGVCGAVLLVVCLVGLFGCYLSFWWFGGGFGGLVFCGFVLEVCLLCA